MVGSCGNTMWHREASCKHWGLHELMRRYSTRSRSDPAPPAASLQVIRMTFEHEQDKVFEAAYRLLENADHIKATVNLEGTSIAIDNVYELWESGVISIPYDFSLKVGQGWAVAPKRNCTHWNSRAEWM